jgi:DtxR family Mn-dependent transcriptional regulator
VSRRHGLDDYLEAIYFLSQPIGEYRPPGRDTPVQAAHVANILAVTRVSAGEMLKRLEGDGLIERGPRKEILLTPTGRSAAQGLARRHRLLERLLTDVLGYTPAEAHGAADEIGDPFPDSMIDRMAERLGHPERCPHGWPIDPALEAAENPDLRPLSALSPGDDATIVRLIEYDAELLAWFYDEGYVPGTRVVLRSTQPAAGQVVVRRDGVDRAMSVVAAGGLLVRRA